jgi:hypothetical protein
MIMEYRQVTVADDGTVMGRSLQGTRWVPFIYPLDLLWIETAWDGQWPSAVKAMHLIQDGFGQPGGLGERGETGLDGARRSTPDARRRMLQVARGYVHDSTMAEALGLTVNTLRQVLAAAYQLTTT